MSTPDFLEHVPTHKLLAYIGFRGDKLFSKKSLVSFSKMCREFNRTFFNGQSVRFSLYQLAIEDDVTGRSIRKLIISELYYEKIHNTTGMGQWRRERFNEFSKKDN